MNFLCEKIHKKLSYPKLHGKVHMLFLLIPLMNNFIRNFRWNVHITWRWIHRKFYKEFHWKWPRKISYEWAFIAVVVTSWVTFFAKYETNRSNRHGATQRTRQKLKKGDHNFWRTVWPWPLTFGSEDGAIGIVILWVILLRIMKRFGQIHVGTERWSGQDKKFWTTCVTLTLTFWPGNAHVAHIS